MKRQHIHFKWNVKTDATYLLHLSPDFNPLPDGNALFALKHKTLTFHGGEPHFQIITESEAIDQNAPLIITQRYNKIGDLFDIVLAVDAARRIGFKNIELVLPYFPAARQDRVCNEGEPLTIKVFTDMINACGFENVTILCPHSEVTPALLNNVSILDEIEYIVQIIDWSVNEYNIVCPDAGAGKRIGKIVKELSHRFADKIFNLIRCEKVRDVTDGSLKDFFVQADDLGGHPTLIVDDIVALGGTFIGLGNKLKEKNCGKLMLFTAHTDCIEGLDKMANYFDMFYTTNSKRNWGQLAFHQDKVTCFNIEL